MSDSTPSVSPVPSPAVVPFKADDTGMVLASALALVIMGGLVGVFGAHVSLWAYDIGRKSPVPVK